MSVVTRSILITAVVLASMATLGSILGLQKTSLVAATVLLILPLPDWAVVALLARTAARHPELPVIKVHADRALLIALSASGMAVVAVNVLLRLDLDWAWYLLDAAVLLPSLGSILWLVDYYRGRL